MLIEYIERMRREPKDVRQRAVFFWTVVLVAFIVVLYIAYLLFFPTFTRSRVPETSTIAAPYESGR